MTRRATKGMRLWDEAREDVWRRTSGWPFVWMSVARFVRLTIQRALARASRGET